MHEADFLVVGGGAAGLLAAGFAARAGVTTLVLEKGRQTGIKILASGGGHCNVTRAGSVRNVLEGYGKATSFLTPALKAFSPRALRRHLDRLGVPTFEGEYEKVWPVSRSARQVRDALEADARAAGAFICFQAGVRGVERVEGGFRLETAAGWFQARRLLIATGGCSYPRTGTTGDGYRLAAALGHTVVEPVPALVPLVVDAAWVRGLSGVSLEDVVIRLCSLTGEVLGSSRGPLLFTHQGLSGPAALDLGGLMARHAQSARLEIDWQPARVEAELDRVLRADGQPGTRHPRRVLATWVPDRLARALTDVAAVPSGRSVAQLRLEERRALVRVLKGTHLDVRGTLDFDRAEVTAGGIALEEVDPKTMASRLVPGLYLAGEVLDYDGRLGGYNLQAAFSTGKAAGAAQARFATAAAG